MDFNNFKVEKKVQAIQFGKEAVVEKVVVKKGADKNYPPDPLTAGLFKVFQTCVKCDTGTNHHLIKESLVCRICGHEHKILLTK